MPLFVRAETTDRLIRYLAAFDKGTTVTYGDLSKTLGAPVTSRTSALRSARIALQKEHAQVWHAEPGVGVRRLTDPQMAELTWWLRGARGKLNRGRNQGSVADVAVLPADQQVRFAIQNVQAELALQALARPTATRLAKTVRGNANDLPAFNMVEWAITLMAPPKKRQKA